jgi:hypothetical protein
MAADKLVQVGKKVGRFQQETRRTSHYVSKNLPLVEESSDVLGKFYPYLLEFKMYNGGTAVLDITIYQKFKTL